MSPTWRTSTGWPPEEDGTWAALGAGATATIVVIAHDIKVVAVLIMARSLRSSRRSGLCLERRRTGERSGEGAVGIGWRKDGGSLPEGSSSTGRMWDHRDEHADRWRIDMGWQTRRRRRRRTRVPVSGLATDGPVR
jgi:hypothetical protein